MRYNLNEDFQIRNFYFQSCFDPSTNSKAVRIIDMNGGAPMDPVSRYKALSFLRSLIKPGDEIVGDSAAIEAERKAAEEPEPKKARVGDIIVDQYTLKPTQF